MEEEVRGIEENNEDASNFKHVLGIIIRILRYVLFVVILAVFVVIVSVITVRTLQRSTSIRNTQQSSNIEIGGAVPDELDWYPSLGEIRGNLADSDNSFVFVVDAYIGYTPGNQALLQELIRRNVQIKERVTLYFSSQYQSDVLGSKNYIRMKNELREIINRIMTNKIREVAFNNLQVIPF